MKSKPSLGFLIVFFSFLIFMTLCIWGNQNRWFDDLALWIKTNKNPVPEKLLRQKNIYNENIEIKLKNLSNKNSK